MPPIGVTLLVVVVIAVIAVFAFRFTKNLMANDKKGGEVPDKEEGQLSPAALSALKNGMCPKCDSKVEERRGIIASDFHCPVCGYLAERVVRE